MYKYIPSARRMTRRTSDIAAKTAEGDAALLAEVPVSALL